MRNMLFIGGSYANELLPSFLKNTKGGLDFAAQNLQEAIYKGFDENQCDYQVISAPYLGSFPFRCKTPFVKSFCSKDNNFVSVSYLNLSGIKRLSLKSKVYREIITWCNSRHGEGIILFYNFSCVSLARKIKNRFPRVKVVLIVTDLPEYMATDHSLHNSINDLVRRCTDQFSYKNHVDAYVVLAEKMVERLPIGRKPWYLMEGIYNIDENQEDKEEHRSKENIILYTGNLGLRYGIVNLLKAFSLIEDSNYQLWFRGNGECETEILQYMQNDKRIKLLEKVSRKELLSLEKKAKVLINPVAPSEPFTSYFFPSKTLEYMASGTPTIMYKLNCLPPEYENHLYFIDGETPQDIARTIVSVCSTSQQELDMFGDAAKDFIMKNKTPKVQIAGLMKFVNNL